MGIAADITADWHASLAALAWQLEMGVDELMLDAPLDRFALAEAEAAARAAEPAPAPRQTTRQTPSEPPPPAPKVDPVAEAEAAAGRATSLEALHDALAAFPHCDLKKGARNTVFCDGRADARVMLIGEAPGRDEDVSGRPFVGRAGQMLDRMFAAIGLSRSSPDAQAGIYITNVMPWRPPGNRDPSAEEIAMMLPFLRRHVALADPALIVVMGNTSARAVLGVSGITRLRGEWTQGLGKPVLPMLHPAYLLRNPIAKREAWADLLSLRARLDSVG